MLLTSAVLHGAVIMDQGRGRGAAEGPGKRGCGAQGRWMGKGRLRQNKAGRREGCRWATRNAGVRGEGEREGVLLTGSPLRGAVIMDKGRERG